MSARWVLPATVQAQYRQEIRESRMARRGGDRAAAWRHLERAHILGQMAVWPHIGIHLRMLSAAILEWDPREVGGQLIRTARAGPGSYRGTVPIGDTGRARSPYPPPAIPADLMKVLAEGGIELPARSTAAA